MAAQRLQREIDETATPRRMRGEVYTSASSGTVALLNEIFETDPLEINRNIRVSQRDFQLFLVASESDEGPNDALIRAAENYHRKYRG